MERKKWGREASLRGSLRKNKHNAKGGQHIAQTSAQTWLNEAGMLKQNAERKDPGTAAAAVFQRSADLYRSAIDSNSLQPEQLQEAFFDLGEVLLQWGESVQTAGLVAAGLPSLQPSQQRGVTREEACQLEASAHLKAATLFRRSHEAYEAVCGSADEGRSSSLAQAAAVNSGNALSSWAEVALEIGTEQGGGPMPASSLFERAEARYAQALKLSPGDVEVMSNLGDCLVRRAELAANLWQAELPDRLQLSKGKPAGRTEMEAEKGGGRADNGQGREGDSGVHEVAPWVRVRAMYERAMDVYGEACTHTDERLGDDLAGLLQNWGAGLLSMAQHCPDTSEALPIYERAEAKLRSSADFRATDVDPFLALSEALASHAERAFSLPHLRDEALRLFAAAVTEGYAVVRKIDGNNLPARLGEADLLLTAGKLLLAEGTDTTAATTYLSRSVDLFKEAVQLAATGDSGSVSHSDQCNALYNLACAASLCGRHVDALQALESLASVRALDGSDLLQDADLAPLHDLVQFQSLTMAIVL